MAFTFSTGLLYHLLSTFGKYDGGYCDDYPILDFDSFIFLYLRCQPLQARNLVSLA